VDSAFQIISYRHFVRILIAAVGMILITYMMLLLNIESFGVSRLESNERR
jgi:hypothetical protein